MQLRIAFGCPFTDEVWRGLTSLKALAVLICRYSTDTANKALGASTVSLGPLERVQHHTHKCRFMG